ncbi:MAG: enoyl-CoA hydratase/isomerase family protein [candidate division NC10 bacterium]|nr:enoyl-CoA hydratase/isomerase family protein [candidate division NC10 bacterium]
MAFKNLEVKIEEGITTLTINRPQVLNALNRETVEELGKAIQDLGDDENTRVIIITGAGEKAFVAGADITEFKGMTPVTALEFTRKVQSVFLQIERLKKPVIAAVNGYALGGGLELCMACDIAYSSEKARFGQPEIGLGIIPGAGGTQRLSRLVGKQRAKELTFTGETIDAAEAYRIGLVNKVVPAEKLMAEVKSLAEKISSKGAIALEMAKSAIEEGYDLDLYSAHALEAKAFALLFATEDQKEGVSAFLEKRKPLFKGR